MSPVPGIFKLFGFSLKRFRWWNFSGSSANFNCDDSSRFSDVQVQSGRGFIIVVDVSVTCHRQWCNSLFVSSLGVCWRFCALVQCSWFAGGRLHHYSRNMYWKEKHQRFDRIFEQRSTLLAVRCHDEALQDPYAVDRVRRQ